MRPAERQSAFTIVELMVVVAIIVLLIALLLPGLHKTLETSHRAVCKSGQRQIVAGALSYADDYNGFLPNAQDNAGATWVWAFDVRSPSSAPAGPGGLGLLFDDYCQPAPKLWHCPSLDTSESALGTPWHSMDVDKTNWWNGVGISYYRNPAYNARRIIVSYNYRSASWFRTHGNQQLTVNVLNGKRVVLCDTPDPRFGMKYCHLDGYNYVRADGSGDFYYDPDAKIEAFALGNGTVVDGVGRPTSDEYAFGLMEGGP